MNSMILIAIGSGIGVIMGSLIVTFIALVMVYKKVIYGINFILEYKNNTDEEIRNLNNQLQHLADSTTRDLTVVKHSLSVDIEQLWEDNKRRIGDLTSYIDSRFDKVINQIDTTYKRK